MTFTTFEKDPAALYGLEFGLSPDAAIAAHGARCAELAKGSEYEIRGLRYKATGTIDAMTQHDRATGVLVDLEDVVEIV